MDCRFSFSESLCAHKNVSGQDCTGHEECDHFALPYYVKGISADPLRIKPVKEESESVKGISADPLRIEPVKKESEGCPHRREAIYCAKVQKFICKGLDDCQYS